jgi:hypothetical protein
MQLLSGHAALAAARLPPGGVGRSYSLHAASAPTPHMAVLPSPNPAVPPTLPTAVNPPTPAAWTWLYGWGGKSDGGGAGGASCLDLGWSGLA